MADSNDRSELQAKSAGTYPGAGRGEVYVALPDSKQDGAVTAHAVQTILVEPKALYELWSDVTLFPKWQEHVVSVTPTTGRQTHWVLGDPDKADGKRLEFDSELTEDVPGQKLAWRSIGGDVEQQGSVTFEPLSTGRGTLVTLIQTVKMGKLASEVAAVVERGPKQTVIENLRHFKQLAETGEIPSVKGQAHGPRGISGEVKTWMYGETNPTPPGTSEQA